jgi:hypothetical protein
MVYALESLGDDRFQRLCQALLAREYTGLKCYPLNQADGGRDATAPLSEPGSSFVVFQVKFTAHALTIAEPHRWLLRVLSEEAPKLRALVPSGAARYVLMTNVRGTAKRNRGSVDRAESILSDALPIPVACWWRDDIERRLDAAWDLKWTYPDLLTGTDLIRYFIETRLNDHEHRRANAIRAFVSDQLESDKKVRFKQVELQNDLFALYVDVPIAPADTHLQQPKPLRHIKAFKAHRRRPYSTSGIEATALALPSDEREVTVGASNLLLDDRFALDAPRIVMEGAPGQGKSTVTQYVCQVHRLRLLSSGENPDCPALHSSTALRLPFRIDLRDFALWLQRKDPFGSESTVTPADWHRSLEAFLAALVRHHSGGAGFTVADLQAVLALSPVLMVFDGLDEVADIAIRRDVVEELQRGINRLDAVSAALQIVVTSRPAAYANSPGLPEDRFPVLHLTSLTTALIGVYADKWLTARAVTGRARADVSRILGSKLSQPHIRDLAKNPMQLAILLSLIHSKGAALPDKRTALYDAYVGLFFDRESEKSDVVREYRDLLLDIHRYLAFILHRDSEFGGNGSIPENDLREALESYLGLEGHPAALASVLFHGVVERVVALVSRVQGTYEFEVQPLREYFAARFLADTAPLSPPGHERPGTKPDRFDAIARNFYWQNVARFLAGCFGKGELPALAERLAELAADADYSLLSYPFGLSVTMLGDWVFSQSPKSVSQVAEIAFGGLRFRRLLTQAGTRHRGSIVLADGCGRRELVDAAVQVVASAAPPDISRMALEIVRDNTSAEERRDVIQKLVNDAPDDLRGIILVRAYGAGCVDGWSLEDMVAHHETTLATPQVVQVLMRAGRYDVIYRNGEASRAAVSAALDAELLSWPRDKRRSRLDVLTQLHASRTYSIAFAVSDPEGRSLAGFWGHLREKNVFVADTSLDPMNPLASSIDAFVDSVTPLLMLPLNEWKNSRGPWGQVVEASRRSFGEHWAQWNIAVESVRAGGDRAVGAESLFDDNVPLCERLGHAARMTNSGRWWREQFGGAKSDHELAVVLMACLRLASSAVMTKMAAHISNTADELSATAMRRVHASLIQAGGRQFRGAKLVEGLPAELSPRGASLIMHCLDRQAQLLLYRGWLKNYDGGDPEVSAQSMRLGAGLLEDRETFDEGLLIVRQAYRGAPLGPTLLLEDSVHPARPHFDAAAARTILKACEHYPMALLHRADEVFRESVAQRVEPVGPVAARQEWLAVGRAT